MKKSFLLFWSLPLTCVGFCQELFPEPIARQLERAAKSQTDTGRISWLLKAANAYILKPGEVSADLDSAILLISQAEQLNRKIDDPHWQGECYLLYAKAFREHGNKELGKREMAAKNYELLGDCLTNQDGGITAGLPILKKALAIYKAIGYIDLSNIYTLLEQCYSNLGDQRDAVYYGLEAVRLKEASPDGTLCTAYNRLGLTYFSQYDNASAAQNFARAEAVAIRFRDTADILLTAVNLSHALMNEKKDAEALRGLDEVYKRYPLSTTADSVLCYEAYFWIYQAKKQLDSMDAYTRRLSLIDQRLSSGSDLRLHTLASMTKYAFETRQFAELKKYALEMMDVAHGLQLTKSVAASYKALFQADSALGDYSGAIVEYQRYIQLKDSLTGSTNRRQIEGLKIAYETEKKDQDILLLTRKEELSRAAFVQVTFARNVVIGGSILLLILLVVIVNRYRIKQRSNELLMRQRKEIDQQNASLQTLTVKLGRLVGEKDLLMKEIHHRAKNNLQIAMGLLNSQAFYLENEKL